MRKVGVSALAAAASFALGWGLLRSITARGTPGTSEELLTRMAADLILIAGALVAGWYFLTALGACLAGGLRLLGAAPRQLERFLGRFGAPVLRKVATWATVSVIAVGSPALAAPGPPTPRYRRPGRLARLGGDDLAPLCRTGRSGVGRSPSRSRRGGNARAHQRFPCYRSGR